MKYVAFLGKSFSEQNKIEKPTVVTISYDGLDGNNIEVVLGSNKNYNNCYNIAIPKLMTKKKKTFLRNNKTPNCSTLQAQTQ